MQKPKFALIAAGAVVGAGLVALAPPTVPTAASATAATTASTTVSTTASTTRATTTAASTAVDSARPDHRRHCRHRGTQRSRDGRALLQYYVCHRTLPRARHAGKWTRARQTSIHLRVRNLRNDGRCAVGVGFIGYDRPRTMRPRVRVRQCNTGPWSNWRRSGWWNGDEGRAFVFRR